MNRRRHYIAALAFVLLLGADSRAQQGGRAGRPPAAHAWLEPYREPAARLISESISDAFAWQRLALMTDTIGPRLSGSPALDRAIKWAADEMKRDGLENVHTEPVMVPAWVRGRESAQILEPARHPIAMLGLGGSVATPPAGVEGEVLVVHTFEELDEHAARARGRIVLLNVAFTNYDDTVRFRMAGPSRAARYGAIAMLIRSLGPDGLRLPHTGALQYTDDAPMIPAASIASEDADRLQRMSDRGSRVVVRLQMEAHYEPDALSANVIGELRGREKPDEIVVVSGHLDSWDVGDGASDDGSGCIVTWEALRLMKKLNLRPRRTVRVVLWTNEENGARGGVAYREQHRAELSRHVMMLEADIGVFKAVGFGFSGSNGARDVVTSIATLLKGVGASEVLSNGGGADIGPSVLEGRIPSLSFEADDSRFFVIHHTAADSVDKIDPTEMARCAAAIAVMAYVVADMPQRLSDR